MKAVRFLALVCAAGLLASPPFVRPASAQAVEDPEALIAQGANRRHLGDNQGAYRLFMRAYSARRTPKAAAHLGACEYEIGLWVEAEAHITEALRAANDAWIDANRDPLVQLMNRLRTVLGRLEVVGRPSGAEVEVAGRTVGRLPLEGPLRVPKGELVVRVMAPGYRPFLRTVTVLAGELAQVVIELDRAEAGQAPAQPLRPVVRSPYGMPGTRGPGLPPGQLLEEQAVVAQDWRVSAGWASAGVAALLAAGAGVGAYISYSNIKQFNDYTGAPNPNRRCNQRAPDDGGGRCSGWLSTAETSRTLSIVSGVGAGAAAIAAIVFFSTAPSAEELAARHARNDLTCAPTAGGIGAGCLWRF
jgi:hypothetical protein